jgi:hypothetical protein
MGTEENKAGMIFSACEWNEEAAAKIAPLVHPLIKDEFREDVNAGRAILWRVEGEDWRTWLVTRIVKYQSGHVELVLEAIAGTHANDIVRELKRRVKPLGVQSIFFETHHPEKAAQRLVRGLGFERVATSYRVTL